MKEEMIFDNDIIKAAMLHPKNLDWEKARRWGRKIFEDEDNECYLWNDTMYFMPKKEIGNDR